MPNKKYQLDEDYLILNKYCINNFIGIKNTLIKDKEYEKFIKKYLKLSRDLHPPHKKSNNKLNKLLIKEKSLITIIKYIFDSNIDISLVKKNFFLRNILNWENFYNKSIFFKKQNEFIIKKIINCKKKKISILEFGSGTGSIAIELFKKICLRKINFDFYITDYNQTFLNRLNSKINHKNVKFEQLDINNFSNKLNKKFDFIIMNNVFHLIKNYKKFKIQLNELLNDESQILIHENFRYKKFKMLLFELVYMCFDDFRDIILSKKHLTYKIRFKDELLDCFRSTFANCLIEEYKFSTFSSVFLFKKIK